MMKDGENDKKNRNLLHVYWQVLFILILRKQKVFTQVKMMKDGENDKKKESQLVILTNVVDLKQGIIEILCILG